MVKVLDIRIVGEFHYYNGDKYVGEWKDDQQEGYGNYFHANGEKYEGQWKNGKMNGSGNV